MTNTFDTAADCDFLYSLFPASFLYTGLRLEYKKENIHGIYTTSFLSPVMALVGLFPAPGMTLSIFWTMIVMHLVSAIIVVGLFTTLTRE
jgi:hypothetical protein